MSDSDQSLLDDIREVRRALSEARAQGVDWVRKKAAPLPGGEGGIDGPSPQPSSPKGERGSGETLDQIRADLGDCTRCKLHTTRTKIVFGEGSPRAQVVFVGEGPGRDEDQQGRPFVGRAGQLLTDIIEKGMGLQRSDVYICNVVKCRPTLDLKFEKDRPPDPEETAACGEFLLRQLRAIAPKAIVTLGNPATQFLLKTSVGITRLRGNWQKWEEFDVMPTYHPSYVLRKENTAEKVKPDVWADIRKVMARVGLRVPAKGGQGKGNP